MFTRGKNEGKSREFIFVRFRVAVTNNNRLSAAWSMTVKLAAGLEAAAED